VATPAPTTTTACPTDYAERKAQQVTKCRANGLDYEVYADESGCNQIRCVPRTPTATATEVPPAPPEEGTAGYSIKLLPGWNMFSVPLVKASIARTNCDMGTIWHYGAAEKRYFKQTPLLAGATLPGQSGYWFKAKNACVIELSGERLQSLDGLTLYRGWNHVGAPYSDVTWDAVKGDCELSAGPWAYDTAGGKTLEAGKGYWIKVAGECTLGAELPPLPVEEEAPPVPATVASTSETTAVTTTGG